MLSDVSGASALAAATAAATSVGLKGCFCCYFGFLCITQLWPAGKSAAAAAAASTAGTGTIATFVLSQSMLASPVLGLIVSALTWSSSNVVRQAANILSLNLPLWVEFPNVQEGLASGAIINAALNSLSLHGQHIDCEGPLITILWFVCFFC
jgi:hypothetical protein